MAVSPCSRLRRRDHASAYPKASLCISVSSSSSCRAGSCVQRYILTAKLSLQVLGAGKTDGAMDAANLLKPMLARGELRCIGATTLAEYRQHMEKDAAFERRFQQACPSVKPLSA